MMNRKLHMLKRGLSSLIIVFFILGNAFAENENKEKNIEHLFELRYKAWKEYMSKHGFYSDSTVFVNCDEYAQIVNLGKSALPYVIKKLEAKADLDAHWLTFAVGRITKKKFHEEELIDIKSIGARDFWLRWYRSGRLQTPQRFNQLYTEWKSLKKQRKTKEADEKYQRIKDLGIDALPSIMQKIEQGDKDLIPIVSYLTDGAVAEVTKPSEVINWWNNNKDKWTLPPVE